MLLFEALTARLSEWRDSGYASSENPAIAEILDYAKDDDGSLRYLRTAQFQALETYWYLRLELGTPTVPQLYEELFPRTKDRCAAMGIGPDLFAEVDYDLDELYRRLNEDAAFVRTHKLESLRESFKLGYPSYILALAMGAGKTVLMGAIAATEFAMAQEYPDGPFVRNALIFAPGKTIIESLREIADMPFERLLPPRMYGPFSATLKLTFTRDGEKELPVTWGSSWNLIVTNSEKIRIQKSTGTRNRRQGLLALGEGDDHDAEIANLRLRAIASLPHLAVFSDEAHHTYGQKLLGTWRANQKTGEPEFVEQGIKKIRRTIDFLAQETNLLVVLNTTGTPYFERQPLRDVVVWYGLGQGIQDGILKPLANNIKIYSPASDNSDEIVSEIVSDFVADYWHVHLPDGAPARMAMYFPSTEALDTLRPVVESALVAAGGDVSAILSVHSKASEEHVREYRRVANDPSAPYRIILLVNMGTEGWNCPSLFACALVRKLKGSNNFALQAATRCLRQVPGNDHSARVYVSSDNKSLLQKQLQETYGTSIDQLNRETRERVEKEIVLRRPDIPPLLLRQQVLRFRAKPRASSEPLHLKAPLQVAEPLSEVSTWTLVESRDGKVSMRRVDGGSDHIERARDSLSLYGAAVELAANYRLEPQEALAALREAYSGDAIVPITHLRALGEQIEAQTAGYEKYWDEIEVALALVKPEGFQRSRRDGKSVYTARISFPKDRSDLYRTADQLADADFAHKLSFHYEGYNFDSTPEASYLERVLALVAEHPEHVEGIWFTGGLTEPGKTELFAEYLGEDGRWHRYTPDFVIQRKDGKHLVVEVKRDDFRPTVERDLAAHAKGEQAISVEGRKAVALKRWEALNPDSLHYALVFADTHVSEEALTETRRFITLDGLSSDR